MLEGCQGQRKPRLSVDLSDWEVSGEGGNHVTVNEGICKGFENGNES